MATGKVAPGDELASILTSKNAFSRCHPRAVRRRGNRIGEIAKRDSIIGFAVHVRKKESKWIPAARLQRDSFV